MENAYDHGYGTQWQDVLVYRREGYTTSVADYHKHPFYEVNLIFSGNIHILLPDEGVETTESHILLTAPGTPHFIACKPDTLYRRLYLSFSEACLEGIAPQWEQLRQLFGNNGRIVAVTSSQQAICEELVEKIQGETSLFRKKLLILCLLSHISEFSSGENRIVPTPPHITQALSYINRHYGEKIVAAELAERLHVGRTTLMTSFRSYTGSSLNAYLVQYRLKQALRQLRQGRSVQDAAELCGFGDSSGLIRNFKRVYGMTPAAYLRKEAKP